MDSWFLDDNGDFLDPRVAENQDEIEHNIKASIGVFQDDDDDGR